MILLTKLETPQVTAKTLRRERLIGLLQANLQKKLFLLCAGAGYGKTTLLSHFLAESKLKHVYYHLEHSDCEPAVFLSYLITGIKRIFPQFGAKTESLKHLFNYPRQYMEIIVGTFLNEFATVMDEDFYIIFEDYHNLGASADIDEILAYFLNHLPAQLHIMISSRTRPNLPLPQMLARDELLEIETEKLRFTREEIHKLFSGIFELPLDEEKSSQLLEYSEGWPTSLRLITQALHDIKEFAVLLKQPRTNIFSFFAEEIFSKEPSKIQEFLIDCANLEWLFPDLCNAVTGRSDAARILSDLAERNAFVFKTPGDSYVLHHLYKEFLVTKITDSRRIDHVYNRAADFFLEHGKYEDAVRFYLSASAYHAAARLIEKIGSNLINQGKSNTLFNYISSLPSELRENNPQILTHYAQSLLYKGDHNEAKKSCEKALRIWKRGRRSASQRAEILYKLGGIYLNEGDFNGAERCFRRALLVCPAREKLTRASILNSLGSLFNAVGGKKLAVARTNLDAALKLARVNRFYELQASILNNLGMSAMKAGYLHQAHTLFSEMTEILRDHFSPGCGAGFRNAAKVALLIGKKELALNILKEGRDVCAAYNDQWSLATIAHGYSLFYQDMGNLNQAREAINQALDVYKKLGLNYLIANALNELCSIEINEGNTTAAQKCVSSVWEIKKRKDDSDSAPVLLNEGRVLNLEGKPKEAVAILGNALKLAIKYEQPVNKFFVYLELCRTHLRLSNPEKAQENLRAALRISELRQYSYLLLKEFSADKALFELAVSCYFAIKYLLFALRFCNMDIHWVNAAFLGIPRVSVDGIEIPNETWPTEKSKKLFFYLLHHKNEPVSVDVLINTMWPRADKKTGGDNLRKAVQHIRHVLKSHGIGGDLIVSGYGYYQIAPSVLVQHDTDRLKGLIAKVKNARAGTVKTQKTQATDLLMFDQEFASGWYDDWVEEMRRVYKKEYEDYLNVVLNNTIKTNQHKKTIRLCELLVSLDYYNEEYHRKLLRSYSRLKKSRLIDQHYSQLCKTLKKELGVEPQKETLRLYNSLKKT